MKFDLEKRITDVKNLIISMDLFEENGWEASYGLSMLNDESRRDDLIARDIYEKKYPNGLKYKIQVDRIRISKNKGLTSLPEINPGNETDQTAYYKATGTERLNGKLISSVSADIFSEHPYFDAFNQVVNTISTLETGAKEVKI